MNEDHVARTIKSFFKYIGEFKLPNIAKEKNYQQMLFNGQND